MMQLFGFEIKRKEEIDLKSFVEKDFDDGALTVNSGGVAGGTYGTFLDIEGTAKTEAELITKYRQMEMHPEVSRAIDDIVNDAIVVSDDSKVVDINLDSTKLSDNIKKRVAEEFDEVLRLLDFSNRGYETFQRFYVDGRLKYHAIIDEKNPKLGIQELRYVDPRKLRKIREISKTKDANADATLIQTKNEYYIFNDKTFATKSSAVSTTDTTKGIRIAKDSIIEVTSGVVNETNTLVLSHLNKAIKPLNQLRMLEDAAVIYRLARAPERRIFYIDVGNLPKLKAEQYLRDMMTKHKNRLVYDAATGDVRDDRKHMTMLEDFWMPRRNGEKGTEITTLPGGANLGEMDDVLYFQKNLYKALNVPITRMESETGFSLGRSNEISRDEVKFSKFIRRLRARFSMLFDEVLEKQLVLKNVMTIEEWKEIKDKIRYNFQEDNHFEELKEQEILTQRLQTLQAINDYVGVYYSKNWIRKNILQQTDEEIEEIDKQIQEEPDETQDAEPPQPPTPTPVKIVK
jgi:hypothetical protein